MIKASRNVKRAIDLAHLAAASIWLGGFAILLALTLDGGACLGLQGFGSAESIEAFRSAFIVPCIPVLMGTAVLYGLFTNWGFAKHGWLVAKWILTAGVIVGFAILPYSAETVAAALAATVALFAISIFKPGSRKRRPTAR